MFERETTTEYKDRTRWPELEPADTVKRLNKFLEASGDKGDIYDLGAGLGRHSIYMGNNNWDITAVEISKGAIPELEENIKKHCDSNVRIINDSVINALENAPDSSILAGIDQGMSHYLNNDEIKQYAELLSTKLMPGGFLTISHFSENELPNQDMGRTKEFLSSLFPEDKWDIIRDWNEDSWKDDSRDEHHAWTALLRKKDGNVSNEELEKRIRDNTPFHERAKKCLKNVFNNIKYK